MAKKTPTSLKLLWTLHRFGGAHDEVAMAGMLAMPVFNFDKRQSRIEERLSTMVVRQNWPTSRTTDDGSGRIAEPLCWFLRPEWQGRPWGELHAEWARTQDGSND